MDKQQLFTEIHQMMQSGQLTREELMAATSSGETSSKSNSLKLSEILYYIGGGIVFIGIIILCYQNWDYFNTFLRIFITLGSCLASLIVAISLHKYGLEKISQAFFLLFGLLAPLAAGVTMKESGFDLSSNSIELAIYAVLTVLFFGVFWFYKQQSVLLFFSIVFATVLFHYLLAIVIGDSLYAVDTMKIWEYEIMVIGLGYMLIGYYLSHTSQKALSGALYGFGSLMFLGSTLALGRYQPDQNAFWELIYPLLVFGLIFLSVYIKSKSFLVFGTIFLIAYIFKLTGEYFSSSLGWPLALVIAGLLIMLIGYYALRIGKKYMSSTPTTIPQM